LKSWGESVCAVVRAGVQKRTAIKTKERRERLGSVGYKVFIVASIVNPNDATSKAMDDLLWRRNGKSAMLE
jgi:hypothetical protein